MQVLQDYIVRVNYSLTIFGGRKSYGLGGDRTRGPGALPPSVWRSYLLQTDSSPTCQEGAEPRCSEGMGRAESHLERAG